MSIKSSDNKSLTTTSSQPSGSSNAAGVKSEPAVAAKVVSNSQAKETVKETAKPAVKRADKTATKTARKPVSKRVQKVASKKAVVKKTVKKPVKAPVSSKSSTAKTPHIAEQINKFSNRRVWPD